ncbi:hypothetical protein GGR57DRAFT_211676 [Xylariaceae sp. FL1272]|nr:hypothetical protein GGR57DRAFT_211676 [Xylariaceae sp. FL1272]
MPFHMHLWGSVAALSILSCTQPTEGSSGKLRLSDQARQLARQLARLFQVLPSESRSPQTDSRFGGGLGLFLSPSLMHCHRLSLLYRPNTKHTLHPCSLFIPALALSPCLRISTFATYERHSTDSLASPPDTDRSSLPRSFYRTTPTRLSLDSALRQTRQDG